MNFRCIQEESTLLAVSLKIQIHLLNVFLNTFNRKLFFQRTSGFCMLTELLQLLHTLAASSGLRAWVRRMLSNKRPDVTALKITSNI